MSHHAIAGQSGDIKTADRSSENMAKYKYLGIIVTNKNPIDEEIKSSYQPRTFCLLYKT
jgi:hypothetical protein